MTAFGEVRDALRFVAKAIDDARIVAQAVKDSREYLSNNYPEVNEDLIGLMEEIRKTMSGVNRISSVITKFKFSATGTDRDKQPARFNDYLIEKHAEIQNLYQQIPELKGSCRKVMEHRKRLSERAGKDRWWLWGRLLKESKESARRSWMSLCFECTQLTG